MHEVRTLTAQPTLGADALGDMLAELFELSRASQPSTFLRGALQLLRVRVAFEAGWWGLCSDGPDEIPIDFVHIELVDLPEDIVDAWRPLSSRDTFAARVMSEPDTVHQFLGYGTADPTVNTLPQRHDLYFGMASCTREPTTGHMLSMALYRGRASVPFSDREGMLFRHFLRHTALLWRAGLQDAAGLDAQGFATDRLLAWPDGSVLFAGERIAQALAGLWPEWDGQTLPPGALGPSFGSLQADGSDSLPVRVAQSGGMILMQLRERTGASLLSPRERRVASLFARGESYKEIARQVGLSPQTVRTYLRDAYVRLGVKNKVELGRVLSTTAP